MMLHINNEKFNELIKVPKGLYRVSDSAMTRAARMLIKDFKLQQHISLHTFHQNIHMK